MSSTLVLRIQSPAGTKRIEVYPEATVEELFEIVKLPFHLEIGDFSLFKERNCATQVHGSRTKTIRSLALKNGDFLYLKESTNTNKLPSSSSSTSLSKTKATGSSTSLKAAIVEDDVDQQLSKLPGTIARKRDPKLCRHTTNGCCVHCSPLEPWDEAYLKEQKIKHMSFHSYLRKLTTGASSGRFVALEDLNCRIRSGCTEHLPWPKGICSKCQPSAITLNPQTYRHVDNIVFENASLVERFLDYWRQTGHQRVGFLYGTYEVHVDVPLGQRANVAAIYEPPQESTRDAVKLLEDESAAEVDALADALGLKKVGWIFTDLISDNAEAGTVKHVRGIDTYFLSAEECILAGHLQNAHPNVSKYASNGTFGSKFVTVCVTGDAKLQVHMEGYAVSSQCMALVRDDCLVPTRDAPELGYIRESTDKQYVPDVYYKQKDQYGNEVPRLARPLPVEYLLVDVPASTPLQPVHTFTVRPDRTPFPIENRYLDGQLHDFNALAVYLRQWRTKPTAAITSGRGVIIIDDNDDEDDAIAAAAVAADFLATVSDFHLLLFLSRMDVVPIRPILDDLLRAVRAKDAAGALQWKRHEVWSTLEQLVAASGQSASGASGSGHHRHSDTDMASGSGSGGGAAAAQTWTCDHCTFINGMVRDACEMCGLPRM